MDHVRGGPIQAQTNDKIEPWHQTLKNNILLENECPPGELEQKFGDFVAHYNHLRYHESINLACCRFRGHRVKVFNGTGGVQWRDGSSAASSSLRR